MMNYETFKETLKEQFMDYMPEEYNNMQVIIISVHEANCKLDALSLCGDEDNSKRPCVFPNAFVPDMYEAYRETGDIRKVMKDVADCMVKMAKAVNKPGVLELNCNKIKEEVIIQVVNTEKNRELLATVPHREFMDLSIIYRWMVSFDSETMSAQSKVINNMMMALAGISEEELYEVAMNNTRKNVRIRSMMEIVMQLIDEGAYLAAEEEVMKEFRKTNLVCLTSNCSFYGASALLFPEKMEGFDMDLWIIPSSIHEILVMNADHMPLKEVSDMVYNVNREEVIEQERLSNSVYFYDAEKKEVSLASEGKPLSELSA